MGSWKSKTARLLTLALLVCGAQAEIVLTPWIPIFKGVERAAGTNFPSTTYENNGNFYTDFTLQAAHCVRVDLLDPDVQFFTTPRVTTNYASDFNETQSTSVSNFLKRHSLQVATVANFYETFYSGQWRADPPVDGLPTRIFGLAVCTGDVVNLPDFGPDSNGRYASLLFTTNKVPSLALNNTPPGTNTDGIYTAVSGYYAVLTNGVIIGSSALTATYPDPGFHGAEPRTLFGLSADRRYLYLLIIDGRQSFSQGANDDDMGFWLLQFGAWDGIAMDGGGSTSMYVEDCAGGNPKPLGHSSYISGRGRERITGSQFGVRALPLPAFVNNIAAVPASLAATINWTTISNATSQVEYGTTPSFGTFSPFSAVLKTNHSVTLSGLSPGTRYYYRVLSAAGGVTNSGTCANAVSFVTTNFGGGTLVPMTKTWKWQTANLDGQNWQAPDYDDNSWQSGPAPLWADNRPQAFPSPDANNIPNYFIGTRIPYDVFPGSGYPFVTYYFRTTFTYSNSLTDVTLTFSNYIDDSAVFYLNGVEIYRLNLGSGAVFNDTYATVGACPPPNVPSGNATCPIFFTLTGNALSNLVVGTNVLAVEVHNFRSLTSGTPSPDVTFEGAVGFILPPPVIPPPFITNVVIVPSENNAAFTWTTLSNATSQILYGTTPALGSSNALDSNLVSSHAMALSGLKAATEYYFRIVSSVGSNTYTLDGTFRTTSFLLPLVTSSNSWRFQTANLSAVNWTAPGYDDTGWPGQGPALLYIEDSPDVAPRNTLLPLAGGVLAPAYYFRTHFDFFGEKAGFSLLVTNFIDDGAVFYLNGREIQRVRMSPGPVSYATQASGCPLNLCDATIDVPDVFRISGDAMTNLVEGDNVFAAEVHQFNPSQSDVVFGSTVGLVRALVSEVPVRISRSNNIVCVSWDGQGFTLQRATVLNSWSDVPGPVTSGFYCATNPAFSTFFRLRN